MTTPFRVAHAAGEHWRPIAEACLLRLAGPPATLGFVYLTDLLAENADEIIAFLREKTGVTQWVGSVGIGICATGREYLDVPAMVVMLVVSVPAVGSVTPKACSRSSPVAMRGRYISFCSLLP